MRTYILDNGGNPVAEDDHLKWSLWLAGDGGDRPRRVAWAEFEDEGIKISTVFLGIDHNWSDNGPPVLFETMIFGGEHDQYQERYCTREEALEGHEGAIQMVRGDRIMKLIRDISGV